MSYVINIGPPFWDETTALPKQNEEIGKYIVKSLINSSNSAYYYMCLDTEDNQVKVIKFIKMLEDRSVRIADEINSLSLAQDTNIIKILDFFRYNSYFCILFPYTPLLSVHQYILNEYPGGIPEKVAANMLHQMLNAIEILHENNIWNRDIKPESFLVFDPLDGSDLNNPNILLFNFEYAKIFNEGEKGTDFIGTPDFMAPEVINKIPYDDSIDIWSLGVSLFMMLTNKLPFPEYRTDQQEYLKKVSKGDLNYDILTEKGISQPAIDLIKSMCQLDPRQRITANDALNNPWVLQSLDDSSDEKKTPVESSDYSSQAF